jgi:riboflavin synthase
MFTGIIETLAELKKIVKEDGNLHLTLSSTLTPFLKIDQSVAHNGICLTVVDISEDLYTVTAIAETVKRTTIGSWQVGDLVNLERALKLGDRLDGHMVQGHIDQIGICTAITEASGSHYYSFSFDEMAGNFTIEKGSITINGVSLTVVDSGDNTFSVAIIPYTWENTGFKTLQLGAEVNLEFDVIGKYVARLHALTK